MRLVSLRVCGFEGLWASGTGFECLMNFGLFALGLYGLRGWELEGLRGWWLVGLRVWGLGGLMACELKGLRPWAFKGFRVLGLEVLWNNSWNIGVVALTTPATPLTHSLILYSISITYIHRYTLQLSCFWVWHTMASFRVCSNSIWADAFISLFFFGCVNWGGWKCIENIPALDAFFHQIVHKLSYLQLT